MPITKDEANEPKKNREEEVDDFGTLEESLISFRLSGPNERLTWNDQLDEESTSSLDSAVLSLRQKSRRRLTRKEKGNIKMLEYDTDVSDSETIRSKEGPLLKRSKSATRAIKSAEQKLRRCTH